VIEVFGAVTQVFRWSNSGERPEIMVKMRLIKVPTRKRDVSPINIAHTMNIMQQELKALNAAEQLRG
jgi:hypothetical protein